MAKRYRLPSSAKKWSVSNFKKDIADRKSLSLRTRKVGDKYNITDREASDLDKEIGVNSAVRGYGMSPRMIDALIDRHKNGNANTRRLIEDQLDDINYHKEAETLRKGDYKGAYAENAKYHNEYGTKRTSQYRSAARKEGFGVG